MYFYLGYFCAVIVNIRMERRKSWIEIDLYRTYCAVGCAGDSDTFFTEFCSRLFYERSECIVIAIAIAI